MRSLLLLLASAAGLAPLRRLPVVPRAQVLPSVRPAPLTVSHAVPAPLAAAYASAGTQKVLELAAIASFGAYLRGTLDPKAMTVLLLSVLVPSVTLVSLSSLTLGSGLGGVLGSGFCLLGAQVATGFLVSRALIKVEPGDARRAKLRRTAGVEIGTMAPEASVFAFTREFCGAALVALNGFADLPTKLHHLLVLPYHMLLRGDAAGRAAARKRRAEAMTCAVDEDAWACWMRRAKNGLSFLNDPFNLAVLGGLVLAALGRPTSTLGFAGKGVEALSATLTPILFLIIGLKFKISGAAPALCASLLLCRHGLLALGTSVFLGRCLPNAAPAARLAAVLYSQSATSIIAYGQIAKTSDANLEAGYEPDLAFQIVALSFPLAIVLNTFASLLSATYVDNLARFGAAYLAAGLGLYAANKGSIDRL